VGARRGLSTAPPPADYWAGQRYAFDPTVASDEGLQPATPTISYLGLPSYPADQLVFQVSAFSGGSGTFAGLQWRIARVTDPADPSYDPNDPESDRYYEIDAHWQSGVLTSYQSTMTIPGAG
jgi:hypothetical protein